MKKTLYAGFLSLLFVMLLSGAAFCADITGKVTICDRDSTVPVAAARVVMGKDIFFHTVKGAPDTIINPQNIAGEAATDKNGTFSLNVPPGNYSLLIWKEYFVPTHMKVMVTGKSYFDCLLVHDRLEGWEKRHVKLDYKKPASKP
jgi:hypothetical protein